MGSNIGALHALLLLVLIQTNNVKCYEYKVGDLDAWGIPTSTNLQVYTNWAKNHTFKLGDSLLFLYPPSQDSVIQVNAQSYNSCNLKDPILYMNNGNSLFNFTRTGDFYFTSGESGHCEKNEKLHVSIPGDGSSPADGPSALPDSAAAPSYPTVFGSIPMAPSSSLSSSPSSVVKAPLILFTAVIGLLISLQI